MEFSVEGAIAFMNGLPPDWIELAMIVLCYGAVLLMLRLFAEAGLHVWMVLAVLIANIQLLKMAQFSFFPEPVALGTIPFASTFFCADVITEYYGRAAARKAVFIGFVASLLWVAALMLTLGYAPLTPEQVPPDAAWQSAIHPAMATLFTPAPAFLAAGLISYLIAENVDIWLYGVIRERTGDRLLWLRNNGSTIGAAVVDTVVFNVLAWKVFQSGEMSWETLIVTFMFGTFLQRVLVSVLDTPFMYLSRHCVPGRRGRGPAPLPAE
ncbi:MAG TPA: queuosine precursor transporter [Alphaproteobacteria bacterium]|nr:queuosine precursor transporter [Alphaproteobacteria bacterium]